MAPAHSKRPAVNPVLPMKITGIRTTPYEITCKRTIADANDPVGHNGMPMLAVWLDTDEGVSGVTLGSPGIRTQIHDLVADLLIGRDPRGVRGHWKRMIDATFKGGNRGMINSAISTIDVALWDLKAKLNNEPLWKTLGASTRAVRAYASGIDLSLSDAEIRDFYTGLAAHGVNAGKLKIGLDQEADLRRIAIMRDALATSGKTPVLMIDSNEYWSPKQAIRSIREIERQFDIFWAEEPARRWDAQGLKQVGDSVSAAIATGENLDDISEFRPLLQHGAVDIVQVGLRTAGITGALMVADLAYAFDKPVSLMNCAAHVMAHVAAVIPNHISMECAMLGRGDGLKHDHKIVDGWIMLTDQPGLGIAFDDSRLAALTPNPSATRSRAGSWGRRRGAGLMVVHPHESEYLGEE